MHIANISSNKKSRLPGAILFIAGLLAGVLIMFFFKPAAANKVHITDNENIVNLSILADSLQVKFDTVLELNKSYASFLSNKNMDSSQLQTLDSLNISITHAETAFLENIDNIQINGSNAYNRSSFGLLQKITNGYRTSLEQSDAMNTIRTAFNIGNTNYSFDQSMLNNMQNELSAKEAQITGLSSQLHILKYRASGSTPDYASLIKRQDSVINVLLQAQKKRNENLISLNTKLKLDNDNLNNKLKSLNNSVTQNQYVSTTMISKHDMDEQLELAEVDCYLSRANTKLIISNAKQRKVLLQNALVILNTLSLSKNISTKQAVQSKLAQLESIAAEEHD